MRARRRPPALLSSLVLASAAAFLTAAGPTAGAQTAQDDAARGVVLAGLNRSPRDGACRGKYELVHRDRVGATGRPVCTHGPDPAPPGVDVRKRRPP